MRGPVISSAPIASMPASNEIMPATEKLECEPEWAGSVTTSRIRPAAVIATPIHWRRPTSKPNSRSAMTARITTPVESTACTTEIGASAIAATCRIQAPSATPMPIANQREEKRALTGLQGVADVDLGGRARTLVLVEEAQLRRHGAGERDQDSQIERHVFRFPRL